MAMAVGFHTSAGDGPLPAKQTDSWVPAAALGGLCLLTELLILL